MGWLKLQKLEYLEDGAQLFYVTKKFLTFIFWHILSYCFAFSPLGGQHAHTRKKKDLENYEISGNCLNPIE